jgi:beta-lactamase class A
MEAHAAMEDGGMSLTAWPLPDVHVAYCAARLGGDGLVGEDLHDAVTPASVMKVQVALTALTEIHEGRLDGSAIVSLDASNRTPGPVGMSLFDDPVRMSVRDLLVPMMTISDNVATDALIELVGLETINATTRRLGLAGTRVTSSLKQMLDTMASDAGFIDYAHLVRHVPAVDGRPSEGDIRRAVAASAALDPQRGSRTTSADMVRLLQAVWTDTAAPPAVCARLRWLMGQQLIRHRIASGFGSGWVVAAKSGGLMGIVRNEVGVVTDADGAAYAIAVFTRRPITSTADPAQIDSAIGSVAKDLVQQLR